MNECDSRSDRLCFASAASDEAAGGSRPIRGFAALAGSWRARGLARPWTDTLAVFRSSPAAVQLAFREDSLNQAGSNIAVDGIFGPSTTAAVRRIATEIGGYVVEELLAGLDDNRHRLADLLARWLPAARYTPPPATYLAWLDLRDLAWMELLSPDLAAPAGRLQGRVVASGPGPGGGAVVRCGAAGAPPAGRAPGAGDRSRVR